MGCRSMLGEHQAGLEREIKNNYSCGSRAQNVILQKLSFYQGIFDLFGCASKPIPLQLLLMGFSIMILLLRHSIRGHTFNSLFHDTYACVAIIGSGHKRSSG